MLIETRNDEDALARTLMSLVSGAVEGIVREVMVHDRGSTDHTAAVADHAGCALIPNGELASGMRRAKGDWLLFIEPGAKLSDGWIDAVLCKSDLDTDSIQIMWGRSDGGFDDDVTPLDLPRITSVAIADLDGDGDMDVLGAANGADDITWWENDGSESFTEHTIDGSFNGASSVYAADVDGDGDMDVLGAAFDADDITWWENDGSESFTEHTIDGDFNGAISVYATDLDNDGDMDVLGAARVADDITWWEQQGTPSKTVSFTDGSSFSAAPTVGGSNQAIGRFNLNSSATFGFIAVTIKLTGTRSGASDFRLWQSSDNSFSSSSDIQLGSMVESDPGTDKTVTFNNFVSPISTSGSFYFLTCDVAAGGGGLIKGVIVSGSSLTFSGGTLSGSISNADLSSGDVSLPVELTSFNVLSTRSDAVTLQWVTESEINNLGFILDRRVPGTEWTEIATYITHPELQGQGSVTHQTIYSYTDNTVLSAETYDYRLADVDYDGNKVYHSMTVMGVSPNDVVPETFTLYPAYPNPFNPTTNIRYDLPENALVNITIYDIMGRSIRSLVNSQQTAGYRSIQWNATNDTGSPVSAGIYLYMIQAGEFRQTKKMVLLK